jgi:hypothetical protein
LTLADRLRLLLDGGHSSVAGRLVAGLRRAERATVADEILKTMKATGYDVRETDPFSGQQPLTALAATTAPIVARIQALWTSMRGKLIDVFPTPPGLPTFTDGHCIGTARAYTKQVSYPPASRHLIPSTKTARKISRKLL